jgi:RND family efflux transporter MFP subunit
MPQTGQAKNPPRVPGRLRRLGVSAWLSLSLGASLTVGLTGCGGEPPARPGAPVGETSGAATTAVERSGPATGPEAGPGTEHGGKADNATSETAAPPARTLPRLLGDSESEGYLGVVVTRDAVDVAAETAGRVDSVTVRVGDRVSRGDVLARLDTRELEQDLGMARASLTAAEAEVTRIRSQVREAETRYKRRSDLPDIFSREELESAKMEMETAEATLKAAEARVSEQEAQVEQLRDRLGRTEIRAPFEGTVALRYLDPGATVLAGSPVVRLLSTEELLVRFAVPPEKVESLAVGDQVEVAIEDAEVRSPATVLHIAPEIDGPSRMVFVEARLDAPEETLGRIRSGLVARVFHS